MIPESKRKANAAYNSKCDAIQIRPVKDEGTRIRAAAGRAGESLQGYILGAVRDRMAREAGGREPYQADKSGTK